MCQMTNSNSSVIEVFFASQLVSAEFKTLVKITLMHRIIYFKIDCLNQDKFKNTFIFNQIDFLVRNVLIHLKSFEPLSHLISGFKYSNELKSV